MTGIVSTLQAPTPVPHAIGARRWERLRRSCRSRGPTRRRPRPRTRRRPRRACVRGVSCGERPPALDFARTVPGVLRGDPRAMPRVGARFWDRAIPLPNTAEVEPILYSSGSWPVGLASSSPTTSATCSVRCVCCSKVRGGSSTRPRRRPLRWPPRSRRSSTRRSSISTTRATRLRATRGSICCRRCARSIRPCP